MLEPFGHLIRSGVCATRRRAQNAAALGLAIVFMGGVGCANRSAERIATDRAATLDAENAPSDIRISPERYAEAFDASAAVLRDAGFEVDRRDFRFGRMTSKPKGSPTVLEFWKPDNRRADLALRSTLGDLRRTVAVSFTPDGVDAAVWIAAVQNNQVTPTYPLRVEVLLERLQVPARRMNGSTRSAVFADLTEVPAELQGRGISGSYWRPIGRDTELEARLQRAIFDRIAEPSS